MIKVKVMSDSLWPHELHCPWNSPGQNTRMGSLFLLQGISPTRQSNPHCRQILYQLNHRGSPRTLEWAYHFPADLPNPGIKPGSPALQVKSLPTELSGKPFMFTYSLLFNCHNLLPVKNVCHNFTKEETNSVG